MWFEYIEQDFREKCNILIYINQGIELYYMIDIVKYIPPFGIIGRIANHIFIKKRVEKIFDYRKQFLDAMFNS